MMMTSVSVMVVQEISVIPGHRAAMNRESRDSGFDASHRPGMTVQYICASVTLTGGADVGTGLSDDFAIAPCIARRVALCSIAAPAAGARRELLSDAFLPENALPEPSCFHLTSLHLTRLLPRPNFPPAETGWF
jgi:hypothetical protein